MQDKFLCFIHVIKAGGTTLHYIFRNNFGKNHITPYPSQSDHLKLFNADHLKKLIKKYPKLKSIGGHATRTFMGYEDVVTKPIFYFTFLRNPIQRSLSGYNHVTNLLNIKMSFDEFCETPRQINMMTQQYGGSQDFAQAKENLEKHYGFIGLIEKYDESMILLKHYLKPTDLDIRYERKNEAVSNKPYLKYKDLSQDQKKKLEQINSQDIELYDYAVNKIVPKYFDNYPGDLEKDVVEYKEQNKKYKFPLLKTYFLLANKTYFRKLIEPGIYSGL